MALDKLNLDEPEKLKSKLTVAVARSPRHSRIERLELEDVGQRISLRRQGRQGSEPEF